MKVTYYLGAGASANSLPLTSEIPKRLKIFSTHLKYLFNDKENPLVINSIPSADVLEIIDKLNQITAEIEQHFTIDTYARKLSFHHDLTHYHYLLKLTTAFFIYEQIRKPNNDFNSLLHGLKSKADYNKLLTSIDYRYDSFFAALLKKDNGTLVLPENINFVSWNYDFQLEQAYMNFNTVSNLDYAQQQLNVFPSPVNSDFDKSRSGVVKLNGTAAFRSLKNSGDTYGDLFDFKNHELDKVSLEMLLNSIKLKGRADYTSTMGFAWTQNDQAIQTARNYAKDVISYSNIVVVIGYSFPYFNRNIDKYVFSDFGKHTGIHQPIIYIQTEDKTYKSIENRLRGVLPDQDKVPYKIVPHLELDQFLIPNEMTIP